MANKTPPLARSVPLLYLAILPGILAAAGTAFALFLASDVNAALLWSQCHARARLPLLSRVPLFGAALCFLPSFFHEALASARSAAVAAAVLALVGGLLTVSLVEAARRCNRASPVVARPTGPWLLFNLLGGAVVWQLLIVPAFLYRAKALYNGKYDDVDDDNESEPSKLRHVPREEVIAIPVAVALGYYLPSILMITLNEPVVICIWLFFPLLVAAIHHATRYALLALRQEASPLSRTIHLESSRCALLLVYALPVVLSVAAHVLYIGHLALARDDRKEMTRSFMAFIEFDAQAIAGTVLYWLLAEVGWEAPLAMLAMSFILGPGAATCLTWALVREPLFQDAMQLGAGIREEEGGEEAASETHPSEQSPLLR